MEGIPNNRAFIAVRVNEHGVILDPGAPSALSTALAESSPATDLFLFSHGWWTKVPLAVAKEFYVEFTNRLLQIASQSPAGLRLPKSSFAVGIHWPSMLNEDNPHALVNWLEAFSFYTMEKRADVVGETGAASLAQLIYRVHKESRGELRVHVLAHSFGCRVVCAAFCAALTAIARDFGTIPDTVRLNLVLLQAAFDHDHLEREKKYGLLCAPEVPLRLLVTRSEEDLALVKLYRDAERPHHLLSKASNLALGAVGPSPKSVADFGGKDDVAIKTGLTYSDVMSKKARLVVADLTPLHREHPDRRHSFSGHHSDILSDELYHLLAGFLFRSETDAASVEPQAFRTST